MFSFEKNIAVDMGTTMTLLYEQDKGIVVREPSVVGVERATGKVLKIGIDAKKMLGRTPASIVTIHPISAGVISDYEMSAHMLRELVKRVTSFGILKPRMLVCVPSSITGVEERAVIDAAIEAGARRVYLLETAVATALGAGIDISKPDGHMVIDIGGGTTEIAVISIGGVAECESIKVAGASFDEAIVRYVRQKYNVLIGLGTAEELKRNIGGVIHRSDVSVWEVKGRNIMSRVPDTIQISSEELVDVLAEPMEQILDAIHVVLERTPPQLSGDVDKNGILMSGGGSLLYGIDKVVERSTGIRTSVLDDAQSCAANGAGKMLKRLDEMQDGMMNFARIRLLKG